MKDFFKKYWKQITFSISFLALTVLVGKNLNPFTPGLFEYHDPTQGARVIDFVFNLQNGVIPPRLAPHFSYSMGYALYNFYAPFAYWVTSILHMIGFHLIAALKMSFLLSILLAFVFMFLFLRQFFSFFAALLGAALYASSPYFAVEVFIRGNLAETWFLALFPLGLYLLTTSRKKTYVITIIALSFLFTVHNVFSLLAVIVLSAYNLLLKQRKVNFILIGAALLLSAYFLIPAVLESHLTYAASIAKETKYDVHFLCPWQIWSSPWGYGGSTGGCPDDGMSFQLGKIQLIFAAAGLAFFLFNVWKHRGKIEDRNVLIFMSVFTVGSLFLTTYESGWFWYVFKPMAVFQFPWRFLVFGMFGTAFFAAYLWNAVKIPFKSYALFGLVLFVIFFNRKFFGKVLVEPTTYTSMYLSQGYVHNTVAYQVPEYFPRTGDYDYWQKTGKQNNYEMKRVDRPMPPVFKNEVQKVEIIKNESFAKEIKVTNDKPVALNIHYYPLWEIKVNDAVVQPMKFDKLARPLINVEKNKETTISVTYKETLIEEIGNIITLVTFIFLLVLLVRPQLWNKIPLIKH